MFYFARVPRKLNDIRLRARRKAGGRPTVVLDPLSHSIVTHLRMFKLHFAPNSDFRMAGDTPAGPSICPNATHRLGGALGKPLSHL